MKRTPYITRHIPVLIAISGLLVGSIAMPAESREVTKVAQLLDSGTPKAKNAEVVTKNFLTLLSQQKFEQATQYISPSLKDYSSTAQLKQLWQKLLTITGPFVEITGIDSSELFGTYMVIATVKFQGSTENLIFKLDQTQKITEADFSWLGNIQTSAEKFVNALAKGDYVIARSYLPPQLKGKFLPATIKQRWEALIAKVGPFKQVKSSSVLKSSSYDIVQLNLEFEKYSGKFYVFFDPLGQIVGVDSPLKQR